MDLPLINAINWTNESFIIVYAFILFIVLSLIERFVLNKDTTNSRIISLFFILNSYVWVMVLVFMTKTYVVDSLSAFLSYLSQNYPSDIVNTLVSIEGLITFMGLTAMIYISILLINVFRSKITGRNINYKLVRMLFYLTYTTMLLYYYITDIEATKDIYVVLVIETLLDMFIKMNKRESK